MTSIDIIQFLAALASTILNVWAIVDTFRDLEYWQPNLDRRRYDEYIAVARTLLQGLLFLAQLALLAGGAVTLILRPEVGYYASQDDIGKLITTSRGISMLFASLFLLGASMLERLTRYEVEKT